VLARFSQASIWVPNEIGALGTRSRRDDAVATYRIAAVVAPWPALAFSASASTGARLPSMLELFGDRALLEANPGLREERSRSVDVSAVARGRRDELSGSVELRGFALVLDDLIAYRRTAQYAVRPENVDSAEVLGAELGVHGAYGRHLSLAASGTVMHTRNQFGRSVPLRPPLQLFARPELALFPGFADRVAIFGEIDHVSFVYLDPANLAVLEARTRLALGAALELFGERVTLSGRVRNVLDEDATDVLSRPLPGTSVELALALKEPLP
jgi:outer membrane cobalamin receptor